jgi:hypothetical protein
VIDHRRQSRGFPRARYPRNQHQTARPEGDLLQYRRQMELSHRLYFIGNGPERKGQGAPLLVDVGPEPAHTGHSDGEVRLFPFREFLHLPRCHDLLGEQLQIFGLHRRHLQAMELAIEPDRRGTAHLEQEVRCVFLDHLGDGLLEIESRGGSGGGLGLSHSGLPGKGPGRTRPAGSPQR